MHNLLFINTLYGLTNAENEDPITIQRGVHEGFINFNEASSKRTQFDHGFPSLGISIGMYLG